MFVRSSSLLRSLHAGELRAVRELVKDPYPDLARTLLLWDDWKAWPSPPFFLASR